MNKTVLTIPDISKGNLGSTGRKEVEEKFERELKKKPHSNKPTQEMKHAT